MVDPSVMSYLYKAIASAVAGGILTLILWPFRWARALKDEQAKIHAELVVQRENCLTTLARQGATQIELLGKVVENLEGVRLGLAEQAGFVRGIASKNKT